MDNFSAHIEASNLRNETLTNISLFHGLLRHACYSYVQGPKTSQSQPTSRANAPCAACEIHVTVNVTPNSLSPSAPCIFLYQTKPSNFGDHLLRTEDLNILEYSFVSRIRSASYGCATSDRSVSLSRIFSMDFKVTHQTDTIINRAFASRLTLLGD